MGTPFDILSGADSNLGKCALTGLIGPIRPDCPLNQVDDCGVLPGANLQRYNAAKEWLKNDFSICPSPLPRAAGIAGERQCEGADMRKIFLSHS